MNSPILNTIELIKGGHTFIIRFDPKYREQVLEYLVNMVKDKE